MKFDPNHLFGFASTRLAGEVWSIRPDRMQAYLGARAAGPVKPRAESAVRQPQGAVAVFEVRGVIVDRAEWFDEVGSLELARQLTAAAADPSIESGLLLINSPGGMVRGMQEFDEAAQAFAAKKPLIAQVEGCCCSSAYRLACSATKIFAGPRDDVGNIGTRNMLWDWSEAFKESGIEVVDFSTGPLKTTGVMGLPVTDEQRAFMQQRVDYLQNDFRQTVERGRAMTPEQFDAIATGAWWFGDQAVGLGLIDGVQSLTETLAGMVSASPSERSQSMAKETESQEPQPATLGELKQKFPNASSDFLVEQIEAKATVADAAITFANAQAKLVEEANARAEQAETEAAEAKAEAEKAASQPEQAAPKKPGNKPRQQRAEQADGGELDYRAMAKQHMAEKGCRWSEACLAIKRQHPEAVAAFGGPPADRLG